jgi:uncharacterized cupin superfamily protein
MEGVPEARLKAVDSGLAPTGDGWFVVGVREAAWLRNEAFGWRCVFEASPPVVRGQPGRQPHTFPDLGFTIAVLEPGKPSGLYHAESYQEDFLVLAGECLLLIEGQERVLRAWDFVHCPPGTAHCFVGAGDGPCVLVMTGARGTDKQIGYPRSEPALRQGAGVEAETDSPREAYASFPHWQPQRPEVVDRLFSL